MSGRELYDTIGRGYDTHRRPDPRLAAAIGAALGPAASVVNVGAGAGYAVGRFSGDVTAQASGPAYQGVAGIELRFGHVGLNVQYKSLSSTIQNASGEKVKVGGKGAIGGLSIIF